MVHISKKCSYLSIYVYTRAYACVCVHLQYTSQIRAWMISIGPCMEWGPTPAVSVAGYCQLVTDTCNMNRYEQDMCMYESVQICGGDTNRYKQIQTYLNSRKNFFSEEGVYMKSISVYISCISVQITLISCSNLFICLYSALLRGKKFLYKHHINII